MPPRPVSLQPECFYHLYNRGVGRQPIFFRSENWIYFLRLMREYFKPEQLEVLAYCLMPNHYHLLVWVHHENCENTVLRPFGIAYVKSVNAQMQRVGPLFQGRFASRIVANPGYLLRLSAYIHLNPVRSGLAQKPEIWAFSSYLDYIGARNGTLARKQVILDQAGGGKDYQQFVEEQLLVEDAEIRDLRIDG